MTYITDAAREYAKKKAKSHACDDRESALKQLQKDVKRTYGQIYDLDERYDECWPLSFDEIVKYDLWYMLPGDDHYDMPTHTVLMNAMSNHNITKEDVCNEITRLGNDDDPIGRMKEDIDDFADNSVWPALITKECAEKLKSMLSIGIKKMFDIAKANIDMYDEKQIAMLKKIAKNVNYQF